MTISLQIYMILNTYIIEDDVALNHGIELTLGNEAYECRQVPYRSPSISGQAR